MSLAKRTGNGWRKNFKVIIASPAKDRYQKSVLPYLFEHFSFERAIEIDENILIATMSLNKIPSRGSKESYLQEVKEEFRFILYKETKHFEIKIIYFISEGKSTVYVTDFFPTKMNPQRIPKNQ